MLLSSADVSAD